MKTKLMDCPFGNHKTLHKVYKLKGKVFYECPLCNPKVK